jgi:hypothetical protein
MTAALGECRARKRKVRPLRCGRVLSDQAGSAGKSEGSTSTRTKPSTGGDDDRKSKWLESAILVSVEDTRTRSGTRWTRPTPSSPKPHLSKPCTC